MICFVRAEFMNCPVHSGIEIWLQSCVSKRFQILFIHQHLYPIYINWIESYYFIKA